MVKTITLFLFFICYVGHAQNWMSHNDALATGSYNIHTYVGGVFYAMGAEGLIHSTDGGATWSEPKPITGAPAGRAEIIQGAHDRVYVKYALTDAGNPGYLYYYTTDNGATWVNDSEGLFSYFGMDVPGRANFAFSVLSDNYIVLHNYFTDKSYYKQVGEEGWKELFAYDFNSLQDFTFIGNTWFAAIPTWAGRLRKSTDFGETWSTVGYSGLPDGEIQILASNHEGKLFIYFNGVNEVYMSEDEGETWVATNAGPAIAEAGGNLIANMTASGDDLYLALGPIETEDITTNYIESHTTVPSYTVGDPSGLYEAWLAPAIVEFYVVNDKVYASYFELFSAEGGGNHLGMENLKIDSKISVYPNPTTDYLTIQSRYSDTWKIYDLRGKLVSQGTLEAAIPVQINIEGLSAGTYILMTASTTQKIIKL
ncbi:MAG: hypothetical protein CL868_15140 [Cytophagaceae bacterium]|nr:hypothetical protein [Cytophagaceae bacterium]|tara:strand:- start:8152 stop:9426 length:1275 start_codon:yes stop_codon:yes gene_type:complete